MNDSFNDVRAKSQKRRYIWTRADAISKKQEWQNLITHTTSEVITYDTLKAEIEALRTELKALQRVNDILNDSNKMMRGLLASNGIAQPEPDQPPEEKPVEIFKPPLSVQDTFV